MRPPAFTTVSYVVHNQGALIHPSRDFGGRVHVALSARSVGLDVSVWIHLQNVVCRMVVLDGEAVRLTVFHVPVAIEVVAILVVGHKQNAISPWPKRTASVGVQTRRHRLVTLVKPQISRHLTHHGPGGVHV